MVLNYDKAGRVRPKNAIDVLVSQSQGVSVIGSESFRINIGPLVVQKIDELFERFFNLIDVFDLSDHQQLDGARFYASRSRRHSSPGQKLTEV